MAHMFIAFAKHNDYLVTRNTYLKKRSKVNLGCVQMTKLLLRNANYLSIVSLSYIYSTALSSTITRRNSGVAVISLNGAENKAGSVELSLDRRTNMYSNSVEPQNRFNKRCN